VYVNTDPAGVELAAAAKNVIALAAGAIDSAADAVRKVGTVEGLTTAPILDDLATTLGIDLPITRAVREVLDGRNVSDVLTEFMSRPPTVE
jgi:glycerol-3-phosphate dehydrogenase